VFLAVAWPRLATHVVHEEIAFCRPQTLGELLQDHFKWNLAYGQSLLRDVRESAFSISGTATALGAPMSVPSSQLRQVGLDGAAPLVEWAQEFPTLRIQRTPKILNDFLYTILVGRLRTELAPDHAQQMNVATIVQLLP